MRVAIALALLALLVGCGRRPQATLDAAVDVRGSQATVTVKVTGLSLGKDSHSHLSLDGGPEVMQYSRSYTFRNLPPGRHVVRVWITDMEHRPIGLEKSLTFEIR